MSSRARRLASLRPTSGSLAKLAQNLRPALATQKARSRLEWLRFARMLDLRSYEPLVRLGTGYGGYAIPDRLVADDWVCYSAGLGEDVSFELELGARYGCAVDAFDPTPKSIDYVTPIAERHERLRFHPYGIWSSDSTQRLYVPRDRTHVSHSIANLQGTSDFIDVECRSIPSLLAELGHERLDLLKLDIEGAEYAVLDDVVDAGLRPSVLCVDFHRTTTIDAMAAAVRRLRECDLHAVHVYRTDVTLVAGRHLA